MDFPDQLSPIGQWMRQRSMLTSLNANARLAPAGSEAVKPEMVSSPLICTPGVALLSPMSLGGLPPAESFSEAYRCWPGTVRKEIDISTLSGLRGLPAAGPSIELSGRVGCDLGGAAANAFVGQRRPVQSRHLEPRKHGHLLGEGWDLSPAVTGACSALAFMAAHVIAQFRLHLRATHQFSPQVPPAVVRLHVIYLQRFVHPFAKSFRRPSATAGLRFFRLWPAPVRKTRACRCACVSRRIRESFALRDVCARGRGASACLS
jgi:hypothetical protein